MAWAHFSGALHPDLVQDFDLDHHQKFSQMLCPNSRKSHAVGSDCQCTPEIFWGTQDLQRLSKWKLLSMRNINILLTEFSLLFRFQSRLVVTRQR